MKPVFKEIRSFRDPFTDREAQVGTYNDDTYVVYYYTYGTAVDRSYHDNVQLAIDAAIDYINRSALNVRPEIMDSGSC